MDFTVKGKVNIMMFHYIKNMLDEIPIEMAGASVLSERIWFKVECIRS